MPVRGTPTWRMTPPFPKGNFHVKTKGMLVGKFELNP